MLQLKFIADSWLPESFFKFYASSFEDKVIWVSLNLESYVWRRVPVLIYKILAPINHIQ